MSKKKNGQIGLIIMSVLLGVGAIAMLIVGLTASDPYMAICMYIIAGICGFFAIIILIVYFTSAKTAQKRAENLANPASVAYQLYKQNSEYDRFLVYPNTSEQAAEKAVTNVAGVLSFVFLGIGFFSVGKTSWTAYVSGNGLVINRGNATLSDEGFQCISARNVKDVQFKSLSKYERVIVSVNGFQDDLILDVPLANYRPETVRVSFLRLINERLVPASSTDDPFTDLSAPAPAEASAEQTAPLGD